MIRFLVIVMSLSIAAIVVAALIFWALVMLVTACVIGIPLWFIGKQMVRRYAGQKLAQHPIERLQNLYVDGKIDLFEFERRVARLVAFER